MCGIAAIIHYSGKPRAGIRDMVQAIRHRGPDAQSVHEENSFHFGHARLRILDLDPRSDQPFISPDKRFILIFNGEIYNFKELRQELEAHYLFQTTSDTEVLLAAYRHWGKDCLHRFIGMFAFLIYDRNENSFFGARDRLGIKPFYYATVGGEIIIASEIKSILAVTTRREANLKVISTYLNEESCDSTSDTFFAGIHQLKAGESITITDQGTKLDRYYHLKDYFQDTSKLSLNEAAEELTALVVSSVKYRTLSDVPIGLYYSGGVDSTILAHVLTKKLNLTNIWSLTAVSDEVPQTECQLIQEMAASLELKNSICHIPSDYDIRDLLGKAMWHMEMPFSSDVSVDFALNQRAQQENIIVVLEGQGADESQAGYLAYSNDYLYDLFRHGQWMKFCANVRDTKQLFQTLRTCPPVLKMKDFLNPRDWLKLKPANKFLTATQAEELPDPSHRSALVEALLKDTYGKIQRVLRYKDRSSMMYSRELRVPFLDHRIMQFMASLPVDYKIARGQHKVLMRKAFGSVIPQEALQRAKNTLLKAKISGNIRDKHLALAREVLGSQACRQRGLIKEKTLQKIAAAPNHFSVPIVWSLLQIELWCQMFLDGGQKPTPPSIAGGGVSRWSYGF